jgi:signal transduction histidine kinase
VTTELLLIVDDNAEIHADLARILGETTSTSIDAQRPELCGGALNVAQPSYVLQRADRGPEAIEMVRAACERGEPYSLAFVDARQPPGSDDVETLRRMHEVDTSLHVVLCTAGTDGSPDDLAGLLGVTDRFLVLKKPLDPLEVRQLVRALTDTTRRLRAQAVHVAQLDRAVAERTRELEHAADALRAEREQRAATERVLACAQRMQLLGQLTAGIAHEINNPLQILVGTLEMLSDDADHRGLDDLLIRIRAAIASASRIARIVRDVRSFSSPQDGPVEAVVVSEVLEAAIVLLGSKLSRIELLREFGDAPPALALGRRLEQVFLNVLLNAAAAFESTDRPPQISIRIAAELETVTVEISDNGEGIREEHLPHLFEPFFTTRGAGQGSGLGLAVSKGIVEGFGGSIEVRSRRDEGTVVRVCLLASPQAPAHEPAHAPAHEPATMPPAVPATGTTTALDILVIDDEPLLLRSMANMLRNHRVTLCASAREAIAILANKQFDVIVSDVMMPEMTGLQLLEHLRQVNVEIADRFVLMTGAILRVEPASRRALPPERWIEKPFSRRQLEQALVAATRRLPR